MLTSYKDNWIEEALCQYYDPEAFFIEINPSTSMFDRFRFKTAVELCEACPVKEACLNRKREFNCFGLWGGNASRPLWGEFPLPIK